MSLTEQPQLTGEVEVITFHNPQNDYYILKVKDINSPKSGRITVLGTFPPIYQGTRYAFWGEWTSHPKWGRQLKAGRSEVKMPVRAGEIQKFLQSGLFKGVGPKSAKRLVEELGDRTLEIIDKNPEKLSHIKGLARDKVSSIIRSWEKHKSLRGIHLFLQSFDISINFAQKLIEK